MKCPCCGQELTAEVIDRIRVRLRELQEGPHSLSTIHAREFITTLKSLVYLWDRDHKQVPPMAPEGV